MAFPVIGPDGHPTLWAEIDTPSAADFSEIEQLELRLQTSQKRTLGQRRWGPDGVKWTYHCILDQEQVQRALAS